MRPFGKTFRVILEPDEPSGYVAVLPSVPGFVAHGQDENSALELLRTMLHRHLTELERRGTILPEDDAQVFWDDEDEQSGARIVSIEV